MAKQAWNISKTKANAKKNVTKNIDKSEDVTPKRKMIRISEEHHKELRKQAAINDMGLQEYIEHLIDENR